MRTDKEIPPKPEPVDTGPVPAHSLVELTLFSTCIFVCSALLMQFLLNLFTAFLLQINSVSFRYSLFAIRYLSESGSNWSTDQIYLVYGSGPLMLTLAGIALLFALKDIPSAGWKIRLVITWMAFFMVNALPCSLLAGVFFYDGFGMAFQWMANSIIVRGIIALAVLLMLLLLSPLWQWLFLKTSYTAAFLGNVDNQKIFLRNIYFKPWIYGLLILLLFNWPFTNYSWRVFLLSLGYVAIPFRSQKIKHLNVRINKSDKNIFTTRYQVIYFGVVLALIWVADSIIMFN